MQFFSLLGHLQVFFLLNADVSRYKILPGHIFILGIATLMSDLIAISPEGSLGRRAACQPAWWLGPHLLQAAGERSGESS